MNDKQYTQEMIKNINNRLKTKQEALTFDNTPTEGSVNPVTSEGIKAYIDSSKGTTYTAGENITISPNNMISAIDTTYTAGDNIIISENNVISSTTDVSGTDDGTNWTSLTINNDTKAIPQGVEIIEGDPNKWVEKTWTGLTNFTGNQVWTDGENIYYSLQSKQYVLNKETSIWTQKTWSGLTSFVGDSIWTDGKNIYHSSGSADRNYVLIDGSYWTPKSWSGYSQISGNNIWTDGNNIYFSGGDSQTQYKLDKETSTWSKKTWGRVYPEYGSYIWTDGENIYYSSSSKQYVLNKATSTWSQKTWSGLTNFAGDKIWTDGENVTRFGLMVKIFIIQVVQINIF